MASSLITDVVANIGFPKQVLTPVCSISFVLKVIFEILFAAFMNGSETIGMSFDYI